MMMESSVADMLLKVGVFMLVQALVYLILTNSSDLFSKTIKRSTSFRPARSLSIRRFLDTLADFDFGDLPPSSPSYTYTD
ncbi:uncharacterized protein [Euphorbia lathyris]|uniref:uncharacterized protein n=1 Tax=Euphorbia lathyris TaxID=212925 RepID=UPI003313BC3C